MTLKKDGDVLTTGARPLLPRVNLLPPEIGEARRFRRVQAGLAGSVVLAVGVVAVLYAGASGAVGDAQEQVDTASAQQRTLQSEAGSYRDVTATYRRALDAQNMLTAAMGQEVRYSRFLNDLALTLPSGVWVKNLTFSQTPPAAGKAAGTGTGTPVATEIGTVTVAGVADQHVDVAAWLDALAAEKGYSRPLLQTSTAALIGTTPVVNWQTTIAVSSDALTGRYSKTGG